jgi:hypothetical protein
MPNSACIEATGKSIERLLTAWFTAEPPLTTGTTTASLVQSAGLDITVSDLQGSSLVSIYLYSVEPNAVMRAAWGGVGSVDGRSHLPLDLHFLLTAWADNAQYEYRILGAALECLDTTPILTGPLLYPTADWYDGDAIQVVPEHLETDTVLRLFDSLEAPFRLSMPYVARVVRIDGPRTNAPPIVGTAIAGVKPT